jgi:tRNA-uridine 2-sulfurtransferase
MNIFKKNKTVFVGMSGGVDSSVAALLLKKQGFSVVGIFMKNWTQVIPGVTNCPWEADQEDVRRVCAKIDIPFYTWSFEDEYDKRVVDYFFREYESGRTPNPDVMCNREIKFGVFLDKALKSGADYVATGHYARRHASYKLQATSYKANEYELLAGEDKNKDQTYFLWTFTQKQLSKTLFPIGDLLKPQVRKIAAQAGFSTAEKKDSQGICFLGDVQVKKFLKTRIKERPGNIVTMDGKKVGRHQGLAFYTIGQRHGFAAQTQEPDSQPYYVAYKNTDSNTLVVVQGNENENLYANRLVASRLNWIGGKTPNLSLKCQGRNRYRQPLQKCVVQKKDNDSVVVRFKESQRAITPGQSVVFYDGEKVLGGGVIIE